MSLKGPGECIRVQNGLKPDKIQQIPYCKVKKIWEYSQWPAGYDLAKAYSFKKGNCHIRYSVACNISEVIILFSFDKVSFPFSPPLI